MVCTVDTGPFIYREGQVCDLPDEQAQAYIDQGQATPVASAPEKAIKKPRRVRKATQPDPDATPISEADD